MYPQTRRKRKFGEVWWSFLFFSLGVHVTIPHGVVISWKQIVIVVDRSYRFLFCRENIDLIHIMFLFFVDFFWKLHKWLCWNSVLVSNVLISLSPSLAWVTCGYIMFYAMFALWLWSLVGLICFFPFFRRLYTNCSDSVPWIVRIQRYGVKLLYKLRCVLCTAWFFFPL